MTISELVEQAHKNAVEKGFWEDWFRLTWADQIEVEVEKNNAIAARLALIHSEVSEALEALRIRDMENFAEELADILLRTCDLSAGLGIDLESEIEKKMEENKARGYMHGKRL